jgi:hypothetical protein
LTFKEFAGLGKSKRRSPGASRIPDICLGFKQIGVTLA